jgi:hypothetical protein
MSERRAKEKRNANPTYPEFVSLVGQIAVETVNLEWELSGLFGRMLGMPLKGARAIYLTPFSDRARLEILANAASVFTVNPRRKPSHILEKQKAVALRKVSDLVRRSRHVIEQRHRFVHDLWEPPGEGEDEEMLQLRRIDGKHGRKAIAVSLQDLRKQSNTLRTLIDDVNRQRIEFRKHPPLMVDMRVARS